MGKFITFAIFIYMVYSWFRKIVDQFRKSSQSHRPPKSREKQTEPNPFYSSGRDDIDPHDQRNTEDFFRQQNTPDALETEAPRTRSMGTSGPISIEQIRANLPKGSHVDIRDLEEFLGIEPPPTAPSQGRYTSRAPETPQPIKVRTPQKKSREETSTRRKRIRRSAPAKIGGASTKIKSVVGDELPFNLPSRLTRLQKAIIFSEIFGKPGGKGVSQ